ncbi:MAG: hypothetical protein ACREXT_12055, partial [Gammaproteobacteria bacterium]
YAAGNHDRSSYVRERRRLIDGIVSGDIELAAALPVEPQAAAVSTLGEFDATIELPRAPATPQHATRLAWGILLGIFAALLGVVVWLWSNLT